MKSTIRWLALLLSIVLPLPAQAIYELPSERTIEWSAGLDSVGGIPVYPSVTCDGLDPSGSVDNTSLINTCISNAAPDTAVFIPAGVYLVNGTIHMKSRVVLRGVKAASIPWLPEADSTVTTLNLNGSRISLMEDKITNWFQAQEVEQKL
jgi:hypothetical protein